MTLSEIKMVLQERGLNPLKRFGQNFLHDQNLIQLIVRTALADQPPGTAVTEIGPGLGALTEELLAQGCAVTALEIDQGLAQILRERLLSNPLFRLIEGDALKIDLETFPAARVVVGNLPYYISTPLLARWMERAEPPQRMVFTLQKEVCERLAAVPGSKSYGSFSVLVQTTYQVSLIRTLPPEVFFPRPEVDSAVVRLERRPVCSVAGEDFVSFQEFVRRAFQQRRKKLSNTLGIDDSRRPEEVAVEEWIKLWQQKQV